MILHVGNLPFALEEKTLRAFFEIYGEVTHVSLITDKISGLSKGFGFVNMPQIQQAQSAMTNLNGKLIVDFHITVTEAAHQVWK